MRTIYGSSRRVMFEGSVRLNDSPSSSIPKVGSSRATRCELAFELTVRPSSLTVKQSTDGVRKETIKSVRSCGLRAPIENSSSYFCLELAFKVSTLFTIPVVAALCEAKLSVRYCDVGSIKCCHF